MANWPGTVVTKDELNKHAQPESQAFPGEVVQPEMQLDSGQFESQLTDLMKRPETTRQQVVQFVADNGRDPSQIGNLAAAFAAAKEGRGFQIQDGKAQIAPDSLGNAFYRGVGDVAEGVGDFLGLVANPVNGAINLTGIPQALGGAPLKTDLGATFRDLTGAPDNLTDTERYAGAVAQGGAGALASAGLAPLASAAPGATGIVANALAEAPGLNTIAGMTGGAGAEGGGDVGEYVAGKPGRVVGSLVGGLASGIGGYSAARKFAQMAERFTTTVPEAVALDSNGALTPEGHELANRAGIPESEVQQAYARRRNSGRTRSADPRQGQARREAFRARTDRPEVNPTPQPVAEAPQPRDLAPQSDRIMAELERRASNPEALNAGGEEPPAGNLYQEAADDGFSLTRGQAEQDFDVQNNENSLRVSSTKEGEQARQWFAQQQRNIVAATERFRSLFGPDAGNAADRGQQVKDAVRELRDSGQEGVRTLYREAEALGGDGLKLDTKGIHDAATDVLIDEAVPEGVKRAVSQELARYGIIGEAAPINEAGITKVTLDDGTSVSFRGPVKELHASNAEDLRQAINRLYMSDPTRASQGIKPAIDEALENALTNAASDESGIANAYGAARAAHRQQRETFKAKDIIQNLTDVKKGTQTDVVLPERAIAQVIGSGPDGVSNLRRVKALLLSGGTDSSRQAWRAIQHQALADIFDAATVRNANINGDLEAISGAKLRTAIFDKFGIPKLRELLGPEEFNRLMKLQRTIGAATIPINGTTNPSGTFTKLVNYLKSGTLRLASPIPGVGAAANAFVALAAKGKEIAATQKTLAGITSYDGRRTTGAKLDKQAADFVKQYIESGSSGVLVPTSISLGRGNDK